MQFYSLGGGQRVYILTYPAACRNLSRSEKPEHISETYITAGRTVYAYSVVCAWQRKNDHRRAGLRSGQCGAACYASRRSVSHCVRPFIRIKAEKSALISLTRQKRSRCRLPPVTSDKPYFYVIHLVFLPYYKMTRRAAEYKFRNTLN
jgi:hypothetical protein